MAELRKTAKDGKTYEVRAQLRETPCAEHLHAGDDFILEDCIESQHAPC